MSTSTNGNGTTLDANRAAIAALQGEVKQLRRAVRQLQRSPVQIIFGPVPTNPQASLAEPPADEKGRPISPIRLDILAIVEEAGRPLTTTRLLQAMARKGIEWSDRAVSAHLAEMVRDGTLISRTDSPRGYCLPDAAAAA